MTQIIRFIFAYITFFLFRKIFRKLPLLMIFIIVVGLLYLSSSYISARLPGVLWNMSGKVEEESPPTELIKTVIIKKGDTLSAIFKDQDLPSTDLIKLLKLVNDNKDIAKLNIDKEIKFHYDIELVEQGESDLVEERSILNRIFIKLDNIKSVEFVRSNDDFIIHSINSPLTKILTRYDATVTTSVIASLKKAGMTTSSVIKLINAYSHQLDLQRQIRAGDKITVIAEKYVTPDNKLSHHGKILYASLTSKGNNYNIYLYSPTGRGEDLAFFSENGQSIKGTLLKTPVDVVRISSHFGYRAKHPVLGYGRQHKGVDFAASTGTPIYSSGNGVVQFIGWKSGYGRFILIKHNSSLSTAYAHASKFAKNIALGSKVKQGQVIAYVGSSGHATGPHLHYEVRINGTQVNPLKFKSTPGIKLQGKQLTIYNNFRTHLLKLNNQLKTKSEIPAEEFTINL